MGSAWNDVKGAAGDVWGEAKKLPIVGGILSGPQTGNTAPLQAAGANAAGLQSQFGNLAGSFTPTIAANQNNMAANNAGQTAAIQQLTAQANGTAPSAAELQLRQQGAANAAQSYGLGAALGGRTPGGALDSAQRAAQTSQATTNQQAAQMRAQEQAAGQSALAQALGTQGGQQISQYGQNLNQLQSLYGNQLGASDQQVRAAGGVVGANTTNAGTVNSYNGGIINTAGGIAAKVASDEREKTNIKPAGDESLMKLADALKAYGFEYKHPGEAGEAPGARGGIMAQDALKGGDPGGMVKPDTFGKLNLDTGNAVGTALAMSAAALRRTKGRGRGMVKDGAFRKAA